MWYDKKMRNWREQRIARISLRIGKLTEAIEGVDEELWPEDLYELEKLRTSLAFRRSDLIKKARL